MLVRRERDKKQGPLFFFHKKPWEAMGSSLVDVKAGEPNNESTVHLTGCWVDEPNDGSTVRIKCFSPRTTATHLLWWRLLMNLKHSHRKITMTHTKTTGPNCIAFVRIKQGCVLLKLELCFQCSKNQLQDSNKNQNYLNEKAQYK